MLHIFCASLLGADMFITVIFYWLKLFHYEMLYVSKHFLLIHSHFYFLMVTICIMYLFPSFFPVCLLKTVYIWISILLKLCLLIELFNPFAFNVTDIIGLCLPFCFGVFCLFVCSFGLLRVFCFSLLLLFLPFFYIKWIFPMWQFNFCSIFSFFGYF